MRVSASDSFHIDVDSSLEHTFSVVAVGSFFTIFAVVPPIPVFPSIVAISFTVTIDRASRSSSIIEVPITSSIIALGAIVLARGVLASACRGR